MLLWSMFDGVDTALQQRGISAFRTRVHPTASIETRARQIRGQIEHHYGTEQPIHIIAHSMGGLDARYLASPNGLNQGHRICTVTTLSTPHRGSSIADNVPRIFPRIVSFGSWLLTFLIFAGESRLFFRDLSENDWTGLEQLSTHYMQTEFNRKIINHPGVHYLSYSSIVNPLNTSPAGKLRRFMARVNRIRDGLNDGLVGIDSARWGDSRGTMLANHGEIVGLKIIPWGRSYFDHIGLILEVVKHLPPYETVKTAETSLAK